MHTHVREKFWNVPNTITVARVAVSVPAMLLLLLVGGNEERHLGSHLIGVVMLIGAFADSLDGILARALNQMTKIGQLLDPLADKVVNISALVVLAAMGRIPKWALVFVIATIIRELAVSGLRAQAAKDGHPFVESSTLAKTKTVVQAFAVVGFTLYYPFWYGWVDPYEIGMSGLIISTGLAVYTMCRYFADYFRLVASASEHPRLRVVS